MRRRALLAAARRGREVLEGAGSALDAVIAAIVMMEDDPLFNAGYRSALNADGEVEMDASVMVFPLAEPTAGANGKPGGLMGAGAVAGIRRVQNPVLLAHAVMTQTPHVLIIGAAAERVAVRAGIRMCRPEDLITDRARARWQTYMEAIADHGTVGAAALDSQGRLAAATSTGGITGKMPGRVGDSAIIGAGTFAGPGGAASATGVGEAIMKATYAARWLECWHGPSGASRRRRNQDPGAEHWGRGRGNRHRQTGRRLRTQRAGDGCRYVHAGCGPPVPRLVVEDGSMPGPKDGAR